MKRVKSPYKRILLTLDGSPLAEQALPYAIAQAKRFRAELVLLKIIPPLLEARSPAAEVLANTSAREELQSAAIEAEAYGVHVEIVIRESGGGRGVYPHIIKYAARNDIDLIVMCSRGHGGFSRWLLGSTADRVVRGATVPVLLVQAKGKSNDFEDDFEDDFE